MNQKELNEIRRRWALDKNAVSRIFGCFVNADSREIITEFEQSLGLMPKEETEKYLSLFRRAMSGTLGRNLMDLSFSTAQVADSAEQRLLSALRSSTLGNAEARQQFFRTVIDNISLDEDVEHYVILLACDAYDVPSRARDDASLEDGENVYQYFVCAICPVKGGKAQLGYFEDQKEFHTYLATQTVSAPVLGFLYPAFDGRRSNLYAALYYSKDTDDVHQELLDALFRTEPMMSAGEQKLSFESALTHGLDKECSFEVMQAVHEQLREQIAVHKESKDPEQLNLSVQEMGNILKNSGVSADHVSSFEQRCQAEFGHDGVLKPGNLIDSKKFQVATTQVNISVDPEYSYLLETRTIDGRKYILIPADEEVTVNGVIVSVAE